MINTWNESLLHEELKDRYCGEWGQKEVPVEGSICDAVLEDGTLLEIQTANLGQLKPKLEKLLEKHKLILVYPIAQNTIIETYAPDSSLLHRRKSPKHGTIYQIFKELTAIYSLLPKKNLILRLVFADILEIRIADGSGTWRKKGVRKDDKKLLKIHSVRDLCGSDDYALLVPPDVPEFFTTTDLKAAGVGVHSTCMVWVLRKAGIIELTGKKGRSYEYRKNPVRARRAN